MGDDPQGLIRSAGEKEIVPFTTTSHRTWTGGDQFCALIDACISSLKKHLREGRVHLGSQFGVQCIVAGQTWRQM